MVESNNIIVLKFGGSVLDSEVSVKKACIAVKQMSCEGMKLVIVVSALKGMTDQLLNKVKSVNPDIDPSLLDEVLATGEKISCKLFASSLSLYGVKSIAIDPDSAYWPIYTNDKHADADPILELTREKCIKYILPLINDSQVPVICGFLGKTASGKITTLGRGGSDTTAVLLARCLDANEVILVKDVDGVYTSDPDKVKDCIKVDSLSGEEAGMLAATGAKFLHRKALRYQREGMKIRVTSLEKLHSGTVITADTKKLRVQAIRNSISMITVVGTKNKASFMTSIARAAEQSGGSLIAFSFEERGIVMYVKGGKEIAKLIHDTVVKKKLGKALSSLDGLGLISVRGYALETETGIIQRITEPLANSGINIYGVITILSSVKLFVSSTQMERALQLVRDAIKSRS